MHETPPGAATESGCSTMRVCVDGERTHTMTDILDAPELFDTDHTPETVVDREEELAQLVNAAASQSRNAVLHGPRGSGKTLVTQIALDAARHDITTCHVSCLNHDTQYQVLSQLYEQLTGEGIETGYHTAQLQEAVTDRITDETIVVLDEVDFLLQNDGNDLLYFLSRLDHDTLSIVLVSANYEDLSSVLDERTYSTLQPQAIRFAPYTSNETYRILEARCRNALARTPFPKEALSYIAMQTANIRFGFHWIYQAAKAADDLITEDLAREMREQAVQRYRDVLLADFSPHHSILLEAIEHLTAERESVHAGAVYDCYKKLARAIDKDTLTNRRISDFLKHLELLGIIDANYYYGGKEGKTREIQFTSI